MKPGKPSALPRYASPPSEEALREILRGFPGLVVCYSGGVDSAYLLYVAASELGDRVVALTGLSPSFSESEREAARAFAHTLGVRHLEVETQEGKNPNYRRNASDRCYFCKEALFECAWRQAKALGLGGVVDGFNRDDRGDTRPGRLAAQAAGVRSPLDEAGLGKAEIRAGARRAELSVWDKPAQACLASRLPYGTEVTPARLSRIAAAEAVLHALGFKQLRVRDHTPVARLELGEAELAHLLSPERPELRAQIDHKLRALGFTYVALDLGGYRQGALNEGREAGQS